MACCDRCFAGRHLRCEDKPNCTCSVCKGTGINPKKPFIERLQLRTRTSVKRPRESLVAGPVLLNKFRWSGDVRSDPDNMPELVLELLQSLRATQEAM